MCQVCCWRWACSGRHPTRVRASQPSQPNNPTIFCYRCLALGNTRERSTRHCSDKTLQSTHRHGAGPARNTRRNGATRRVTAFKLQKWRFEATCETNCFLHTPFRNPSKTMCAATNKIHLNSMFGISLPVAAYLWCSRR